MVLDAGKNTTKLNYTNPNIFPATNPPKALKIFGWIAYAPGVRPTPGAYATRGAHMRPMGAPGLHMRPMWACASHMRPVCAPCGHVRPMCAPCASHMRPAGCTHELQSEFFETRGAVAGEVSPFYVY